MFLDKTFTLNHKLSTRKLAKSIPGYNIDGSHNQGGSIEEEVDIIIYFKKHNKKVTFCHESDVPLFSSTHSQPVTTFALTDIQTDTTIHMYSKDMSIILERVVFVV
jgi:hypothetical protein